MIKMKIKAFLKYGEYRNHVLKKIKERNLYSKIFSFVVLAILTPIIICTINILNVNKNAKAMELSNIYGINEFIVSNNRNLAFLSKFMRLKMNNYQLSKQNIEIPKNTDQNPNKESSNFNMIEKQEYDKVLERANQLEIENKLLEEDNLNLQNWVKNAASRGTKPRNYVIAPPVTSRSGVLRGEYLGRFTVTAYTPTVEECGNNKGITCSGYPIVPGVTVAVDTKYWPLGTVFYIKGLGYVMAMDSGGAIKGKNRFDFAVLDKNFAKKIGVNKFDVYLIKMGNGNIGELKF